MNKKFSIKKHVTIRLNEEVLYLVGNFENLFFTISGKTIVINTDPEKPFCWDGCSPKFLLFGKLFGTPDGRTKNIYQNPINPIPPGKPETYWASLAHDVLYKCKGNLSRSQADKIFLELMVQQKFKFAKAYYMAVRLFGWFWWVT